MFQTLMSEKTPSRFETFQDKGFNEDTMGEEGANLV
jgi:hypothetical protein